MEKQQANELLNQLGHNTRIAILTHRSPDGDAIGSSLALYHILQQIGNQQAQVIVPDPFPRFLEWLPASDQIVVASEAPEKANQIIREAEVIFCLDFNALNRIGSLGDQVRSSPATKVLVDHHREPETFATYALSRVEASSTCELVYDLIDLWDKLDHLNAGIAQCLYTGIMTDTGSFRFKSTGKHTHEIVAHLMDEDLDIESVYTRIHDTNRLSRLRLVGYALSEKLVHLPEYNASYIALSQEELQRFAYQKGDTEGLVNYGLSIEGVVFTAFMRESEDGYIKLSLRSKGPFDVNKVARTHFQGGGHLNAAGGRFDRSLPDCIRTFEELLPEYRDALLSS